MHIIRERLNADRYSIFLNNIFDFFEDISLNFIATMRYQHDGAPPIRGGVDVDCLSQHFIKLF